MGIKTVGIVGAGQMGNGIAHVMSLAGYDVMLNYISVMHWLRLWRRSIETWKDR